MKLLSREILRPARRRLRRTPVQAGVRSWATLFAALVATAATAIARAESESNREFSFHLGGGLSMGSTQLSAGGPSSGYLSQGFLAEGGVSAPFSRSFGAFVGGEYGQVTSANSSNSSSFFEFAAQSSMAGKAGFFWGPVHFGGGYRLVNLTVKSLTAVGGRYQESTFSGGAPMGTFGFSFEARRKYRATVELQYATGSLPGSGAASVPVSYSETSLSLRVFGLFD